MKLHTTNIFGNSLIIEGRLIGEATHGFNTAGGGWALFRVNESDTPAEFYVYVPKGKRKPCRINKNDVVKVEP